MFIPIAVVVIVAALLVTFGMARTKAAPSPPASTLGPHDLRRRQEELRDALDRTPLGETPSKRLWRRLESETPGAGLVHALHRDFCGHGLIRTARGVKLCDIHDGGSDTGDAIAEWQDEDSFVTFFARQTDFSMSGWDHAEPVFHSSDDWYRNNQRLTRAILERYAAGH